MKAPLFQLLQQPSPQQPHVVPSWLAERDQPVGPALAKKHPGGFGSHPVSRVLRSGAHTLALGTHAHVPPAPQLAAGPSVAVQLFAQVPHVAGFVREVSQPSAMSPLQSAKPAAHVETAHFPGEGAAAQETPVTWFVPTKRSQLSLHPLHVVSVPSCSHSALPLQ